MSAERDLIVVVEDIVSEALMRRVLAYAGYSRNAAEYKKTRGNGLIRKNLEKYRGASRVVPHIVLTDLDRYSCPPELLEDWKVGRLPGAMLFRIAVREVEAWLLADRNGIARFLHTAIQKVPPVPEALADPKKALFSVIRKSHRRRLIEEMIPQAGAHIGPFYNDRMQDFILNHWRIEEAMRSAPSLNRCIERVYSFLKTSIS